MTVISVMEGSVFTETWFMLLLSFVAVNTLMYLTLAISKMLPKFYLGTLRKRRHERSQERSIYPDGMESVPSTTGDDDPEE